MTTGVVQLPRELTSGIQFYRHTMAMRLSEFGTVAFITYNDKVAGMLNCYGKAMVL